MKKLLLALAAFMALFVAVRPSTAFYCTNCESELSAAANWAAQAKAMLEAAATQAKQLFATAHDVSGVATAARGLAQDAMRNTLPEVGSLTGIVSGLDLGERAGRIGEIAGGQRVETAGGPTWMADELDRRERSIAGIQELAATSLEASQARQRETGELLSLLAGSQDIQETAAIQARLQLESNVVGVQQVQALNLIALSLQQERLDRLRLEQRQQRSAEDYVRKVGDTGIDDIPGY